MREMDGLGAFLFVLIATVAGIMSVFGIFAVIHILYQKRATPMERRMWGIG